MITRPMDGWVGNSVKPQSDPVPIVPAKVQLIAPILLLLNNDSNYARQIGE